MNGSTLPREPLLNKINDLEAAFQKGNPKGCPKKRGWKNQPLKKNCFYNPCLLSHPSISRLFQRVQPLVNCTGEGNCFVLTHRQIVLRLTLYRSASSATL